MNFFDWTSNPKNGNLFFQNAIQTAKESKDVGISSDDNIHKMFGIDEQHENLLKQLSDHINHVDLMLAESQHNNEELDKLIQNFSELNHQMEILYGKVSEDYINEMNQ